MKSLLFKLSRTAKALKSGRLYATLAVTLAVGAQLSAQTDVTSTYLTNADFNTNANFKFDAAAANLASANAGANIKEVEGWTRGLMSDNSAAATFEYGYAGTINLSGTTYGFIPATGPDGTSTGAGQAALGISTAWSGTVTYTQNVTLPAGKYAIITKAYNSGPSANSPSRVGWAPTGGTAVISARTTFAMAAWTTDTVTFKNYATTAGKIQVGITSANVGSGSVGRIFFDHVRLVSMPVDKVELKQMIDSAAVVAANPKPVGTSTAYTDLNTAKTAAQAVYDNAAATSQEILENTGLLLAAIRNVHSAVKIQERKAAWTTLPYDITSIIVNPSFEVSATSGWTNVGGFVGQTNTSFPLKAGNTYVEKWKSSGNWTGLKLSQVIADIPNGIYSMSAAALNHPNTVGGAFVYVNAERAEVFGNEDKTLLVTVTNNKLEIGYEVVNGGNYVGVDNFRLSYISDGSPYMVASPTSLFFDPNTLTRNFTITGGNLSDNATLTAPTGISLSINTLTPAQVAAGAEITATYDNQTAINDGKIEVKTGSLVVNIAVVGSADNACFTKLYPDGTNLIPNPYLNDISQFAGWGRRSVVTGSEAYCGARAVKFDALTNGWPDGAALDVNGIQWKANTWYRVRAMVKTVDGTLAFFAKGTDPDVTIPVAQSNENWVEIDQTFKTGAAPTTNFFSLNNVDGGSTGKIAYIDNWELYELPLGTSVANPSIDTTTRLFVSNGKIAVRFNLEASSEVDFSVFNLQGMQVATTKSNLTAGTNQVEIAAGLEAGVYIVKMKTAAGEETLKTILK